MIELKPSPFPAKEVISLDFSKLSGFLTFLEKNLGSAISEIIHINERIACLDVIKQDIKDIKLTLVSVNKRLDTIDTTIYNHHHKILQLETEVNSHESRILLQESNTKDIFNRLMAIEQNLKSLNPITEENVKNIEKLFISTLDNSTNINRNKETLEYHNNSMKNISFEVSNLKTSEKTVVSKHKKFKQQFNDKVSQIITKFQENDNNFDMIYENLGLERMMNNKLDVSNISGDINANGEGYKGPIKNEEFKAFVEKTNNEIQSLFEQLKTLKENKNLNLNENYNEIFKTGLIHSSSRSSEFLEEIKEIKKNEKFIISTLFTKIGKEELDKAVRLLNQEIVKINSKLSYNNSDSTKKDLISASQSDSPLKNSEGKDNYGMFRINFYKIIQEEEKFFQVFNLPDKMIEETNKLYESILDIRSQLQNDKEKITINENIQGVSKEIFEIKVKINSMELLIESLSKSDTFEVNNRNSSSSSITNIKDYVRNLSSEFFDLKEKVENNSNRIENMNSDLLARIKFELLNESTRILDDFKISLKGSILRIQEQMREKVDKINMDDFSKKFEQKLINEVSKKLDRNDLKKNTNLINKKIENIENKISRTLVDTLIDLQLDEAPLIVKKSQKGDKCGSCNQFVPSMSSGNLVAQLNHQKQNDEKSNMICTMNSTSIDTFKKAAANNTRNKNKEGMHEKMLKSSSSAFISKVLPDITNNNCTNNNINSIATTKQIKNNKENTTPVKKVSTTSQVCQIKYLDEYSERRLNNMINEELEKEIVRPEMLLRVGNKVYDSIEKKNNK